MRISKKHDKQWWVHFKKEQKTEAPKVALAPKETVEFEEARLLVERFIASRKLTHPLPMARFKPLLTKLDPDFSEKKLGYRYFKQFVEDLVGDLIEEITEDGYTLYVHFKEIPNKPLLLPGPSERPESNHHKHENGVTVKQSATDHFDAKKAVNAVKNEAKAFLDKILLYQPDLGDRLKMSSALLQGMRMYPGMTPSQMKVYLQIHAGLPDDERIFEKYVTLLQQIDLFETVQAEENETSSLLQLKADYYRADKLDEAYIEAIGKELSTRFKSLSSGDILDLLFSLSHSDV